MSLNLSMIMYEQRIEAVANSVGVICEECNQSAYYFCKKNDDFHSDVTCIICLKEKARGILLEDFISTLQRHIPHHYTLVEGENSDSDTILLKGILARFTYDDENVLEKLANLLHKENSKLFPKEGLYKPVVDDDFIEECRKKTDMKWHEIAHSLKYSRRFTNEEASVFFQNLIGSCLHKEGEKIFNAALKEIKKGDVFYRARIVKSPTDKKRYSENPEKELAAPPSHLATNNRMSPSGISFMYTAGNMTTAISEIRPYVGDTVAIGEFKNIKDLNFFDFSILDKKTHQPYNLLDNPKKFEFLQYRFFLRELHKLISKPFRVTDTSYIETQTFAEIIRNYMINGEKVFDGIIFRSAQNESGLNYILFDDDASNEMADNTNQKYHMELNPESKIRFVQIKKMEITYSEED